MSAKYDRIGQGYNHTRRADPYLASRLLHHLRPDSSGLYLDLGCGTGNYTVKMSESGLKFIGVDPSATMLEGARARGSSVDWREGRAEAIPVDAGMVDGVTASFTLHHWADLKAGFREIHRVLAAGGRVVVLTSTPEQMEGYWLNAYFPEMMKDSMRQMPSFEVVKEAMEAAGLRVEGTEKYFVREDLQDGFLYSAKHDPRRYLDAGFRQGISSFSDLARQEEVRTGLLRLDRDIETGAIDRIVERYANGEGDYLFIWGWK